MLENKIKEILQRNQDIRIIFFFDTNKSRYEEFQNLKIENLEKIEVDERYFSLKNRLEYELKDHIPYDKRHLQALPQWPHKDSYKTSMLQPYFLLF